MSRKLSAFFMVLKMLVVFIVELIMIITLLNLNNHSDCIINFMAITTIIAIDELFYQSLPEDQKLCISSGNKLDFENFGTSKAKIKVNDEPPPRFEEQDDGIGGAANQMSGGSQEPANDSAEREHEAFNDSAERKLVENDRIQDDDDGGDE